MCDGSSKTSTMVVCMTTTASFLLRHFDAIVYDMEDCWVRCRYWTCVSEEKGIVTSFATNWYAFVGTYVMLK